MDLTLIRHGRIQGRPLRPRDESPLSALGRAQAQRVADYLTNDPAYAALVCSPLLRARQTALIIGDRLKMEPLIVEALTEMTGREMGWIVLAEVAERFPLSRHQLIRRAGDVLRAPLIGRVSEAVANLIAAHTDQRVLVVAHGGVIWSVLTHFFPEQRGAFTKQRQVANCSITRITIAPDGSHLIALNETAHLGDAVTY